MPHEDKLEIYKLKKQGVSWSQICSQFDVNVSGLKYLIRLMDRYGIEVVKKTKNTYYSLELKKEIMDTVFLQSYSLRQVSRDYALPTDSILSVSVK